MAYEGTMRVTFRCSCGAELVAVLRELRGELGADDMMHCTCGKVYVVGRPYIADMDELDERAVN